MSELQGRPMQRRSADERYRDWSRSGWNSRQDSISETGLVGSRLMFRRAFWKFGSEGLIKLAADEVEPQFTPAPFDLLVPT